MRDRVVWLIGAGLVGAVACGGDGSGPSPGGDEGARVAARFDQLADSVDREGLSPTAEALRHAAQIVRLTGHATPVTLTIDGNSRPFQAVAEQLDIPQIQCWWPADSTGLPPADTVVVAGDTGSGAPPSGGPVTECTAVGTFSMRTLIAWEPERMAEVVRLVADPGSNQVDSMVPDVMTGLPASPAPPDTVGGGGTGGGSGGGAGGSPGSPGFMGEYLVDNAGVWFAVEGSQTNELTRSGGDCTADQATFDWAEFRCEEARFGYRFTMRLEPLLVVGGPPTPAPGGMGPGGTEPLTDSDPGGGAGGEHVIALARSEVDGVRLTVVAWAPPPVPPGPEPVPPPEPLPPDSAVTNR
jgi:hypothetical protein